MYTGHNISGLPLRSTSGVEAGATEDSRRYYRPRAKRAHADGPNENAYMPARKRACRTRRTSACNSRDGASETTALGIESSPLHPLPPLPVELCDCIAGHCDDATLCTLRAASRTHRAWVDRQARWLELAVAAAHAPFARRRRRLTAPQAQEAVAALWSVLRQPGEGTAAATPFVLRLCVAALRRPLPLRFAQVDRENEIGARGGPASGRAAGACVPLPPEWRPEWRTEWRRRRSRSRPAQADAAARRDEQPHAPAAQAQAHRGDGARWPHQPQCHYQWLVRLAHGSAFALLEAGDTHVTLCDRADWPPHVAFLSVGTYAAWDHQASRGARRCCSECPSLLVRVQPTADGAEGRGSGPSGAAGAVAVADVRGVLVGENGHCRSPLPGRCCRPTAAHAGPSAPAPAPSCARAESGPTVEHCTFSLIIARRQAPPAGTLHTVVTSLAQSVAGYALPEPLPPPVARRLAWTLCGVATTEAEAEGPVAAGLAALRALLVIASGARQVRALHIFFVHGKAGPLLAAGELAFALRCSTPGAARHVERAMLLEEEAACDGHGGPSPAVPVRVPIVCVRPFAVLPSHAATPASVPLLLVRLLEVVADAVAAMQRVLPGYSLHDYDPSGETARCMQAAWLLCSAPPPPPPPGLAPRASDAVPQGTRGSADNLPLARRRLLSLLAMLRALDARVPSPTVGAALSRSRPRPLPWPWPRPGLLLQPRPSPPPSSHTPYSDSTNTRTDHAIGDSQRVSTVSAPLVAERHAREPSCPPPHLEDGLAPLLPPHCNLSSSSALPLSLSLLSASHARAAPTPAAVPSVQVPTHLRTLTPMPTLTLTPTPTPLPSHV